MGQHRDKVVLFLCTGNYYRSRFAECLFNSVAARIGLPWRASSRGLALERGAGNVGPMAASAVQALQALGVGAAAECGRLPAQATAEDLRAADLVVALKDDEHRPLLAERFPGWAGVAEFWDVDDAPGALALIEREVMDLAARLVSGARRGDNPAPPEPPAQEVCPACRQPAAGCACRTKEAAARGATARVGRETKGRRGKGVTTVSGLPLDEAGLEELAAKLKHKCGTGGAVKDSRIEIQGDLRDRIALELEKLGYRVKRVGG